MQRDAAKGGRTRQCGRTVLFVLIAIIALAAISIAGFQLWKSTAVPPAAPVIGLSLDSAWYNRIGVSQAAYEFALTRVDAETLGFRSGDQTAKEILDRIDGLLLCGGGDIDPSRTGGDTKNTYGIDPAHDALEEALIHGALERDMPILGICRGIQILNVVHGGTLRNLHEDDALLSAHGIDLDSFWAHPVTILDGSLLGETVGIAGRTVNSFHGHAVGRLGADLVAVAFSPDGVIEAIERPDRSFVIGMQWHPEIHSLTNADDLAVFRGFVTAAERYRAERSR